MSNRLQFERREHGWSLGEYTANGELPVPRDGASVAVRLRPDDVVLAPVDQPLDGDVVSFLGRGRRLAVRRAALRRRRQRRWPPPRRCKCPAAASAAGHASFLSAQPVTAGFATTTAIYFDGTGSRIAGHVPVEAPAPVGA